MAWTRAEVDLLAAMYPDPAIARADIEGALPRQKWGAIRKQAHKIGVQRPRLVGDKSIHPLLKAFGVILQKQRVSAVAVLQESGRSRGLAADWFRGHTDPRLSHFDGALREAGFRLAILPLDPPEPARAPPVRYFAPTATSVRSKATQATSAAPP